MSSPLALPESFPAPAATVAPVASDATHIAALTGVRALAALWVVLFHIWIVAGRPNPSLPLGAAHFDLTPLLAFGWLGVDVFFVLSGFLLTRQAWTKVAVNASPGWLRSQFGETYLAFLRRRILRVYPAYCAVISILLVLAAIHLYGNPPPLGSLLLHLVMFQNLIGSYLDTINAIFWTMPFEWQFYLVFPLLFVLLRRTNIVTLYLMAAVLALGTKAWVVMRNDGYMQLQLPVRLDAFVAGMCAATIAERYRFARWTALFAFAAGLAGLLSTPWIYAAYPMGWHYFDGMGLTRPFWVQASVCLFLIGLSGKAHVGVRLFSHRWTVWLGLVSYSIYLVHVPVLGFVRGSGVYAPGDSGPPASLAKVLVLGVPAIIAVSAILYYFVERPFQASAKRLSASRAASVSWLPRSPFAVLGVWALLLFAFLVTLDAVR